jgi:hypothetical protein
MHIQERIHIAVPPLLIEQIGGVASQAQQLLHSGSCQARRVKSPSAPCQRAYPMRAAGLCAWKGAWNMRAGVPVFEIACSLACARLRCVNRAYKALQHHHPAHFMRDKTEAGDAYAGAHY